MKTVCPPAYHHNGFKKTHSLGHMMYGSIYIIIDYTIRYKLDVLKPKTQNVIVIPLIWQFF